MRPQAIVLSPGPCTPNEAGICLDLIREANGEVPILGVCLGHQAIGQAYGGEIVRTAAMHGKVSRVHHTGKGVFRGLNNDFEATRYHSLTIAPDSPADDARGDRQGRRRRDHGRDAQDPSRARRAVPSRKHRLRTRPRAACRTSSTSPASTRAFRHERRRICFRAGPRAGRRNAGRGRFRERLRRDHVGPSGRGRHCGLPARASRTQAHNPRNRRRRAGDARQDADDRQRHPAPSICAAPAATATVR